MEAYCMKCKTKREMSEPQASFNAKGSPVTIGVCPVCGTKLFRMGKTGEAKALFQKAVAFDSRTALLYADIAGALGVTK